MTSSAKPAPEDSHESAKQAESLPGGYHTIAPYIIVPRAAEFIEFLNILNPTRPVFKMTNPNTIEIYLNTIDIKHEIEPVPAQITPEWTRESVDSPTVPGFGSTGAQY